MQKVVYLMVVAQFIVLTFGRERESIRKMLQGCSRHLYDLGFLLDASHMGNKQFNREVAIMKGIVRAFNIRLGSNRAGLVIFNNRASTVIRRRDPEATSVLGFEARVSNLQHSRSAYIDRGIDKVAETLYSPADDILGYRKVLFVLTDGRQREPVNLRKHTRILRIMRVKIIVIAMGPNPKRKYINDMVKDKKKDVVESRYSRTPVSKTVLQAVKALCLARPKPPGPTCKSKVDIAFLLDASGSVGRKNWLKEPAFVMNVLKKLGDFNLENGVRAAVIIYSNPTDVRLWIKLNDFNSIGAFEKKLYEYKYVDYQKTAINTALTKANNEVFQKRNGDRTGVQDVLVLITDGVQNPKLTPPDTLNNYAQPLRDKGIITIAVGVGKANTKELQMIAGDPNRVFALDNIHQLGKAVDLVSSKICISCPVNIAFVLDSSKTTRRYYHYETKLVKFVSTRLQVAKSKTKVAVISFSTEAVLNIAFGEFQDSQETFGIHLEELEPLNERTNIQQGLLFAEKAFKKPTFVTLDNTLPKVIVVVSDGHENEGSAIPTARRLRREGFHIIAVSLGRPDDRLLNALTGNPQLVFDVDYRREKEIDYFNTQINKVVSGVCKIK